MMLSHAGEQAGGYGWAFGLQLAANDINHGFEADFLGRPPM
jgi:hypothetical protein